jgi:hypothetical protein
LGDRSRSLEGRAGSPRRGYVPGGFDPGGRALWGSCLDEEAGGSLETGPGSRRGLGLGRQGLGLGWEAGAPGAGLRVGGGAHSLRAELVPSR